MWQLLDRFHDLDGLQRLLNILSLHDLLPQLHRLIHNLGLHPLNPRPTLLQLPELVIDTLLQILKISSNSKVLLKLAMYLREEVDLNNIQLFNK